jgi:hypothetical protein
LPKLRDSLESDIGTFINSDEFASDHTVNGVHMLIILDNDLLKERQRKSNDPDGIYIGDLLFHVAKSVFGEKPVPGEIINLDSKIYRVADAQEDEEMYSITLEGNMS